MTETIDNKECDFSKCNHRMQKRCTECGKKQYAVIVWPVSHGWKPCAWCGKINKVEVISD